MQNFYFVVLHYQAIKETTDCVASLKSLDQSLVKNHIIVVDNASPNGSGSELVDIYKNDELVEVILSKENVGFAKGNNIGFSRAKYNDADFIALINNDTLIKDKQFVNKIVNIHTRTQFSVLGPDILSIKDGVHQNPTTGFDITPNSLRRRIFKAKIILLLNRIGLTGPLLSLKKINKIYRNNYTEECLINESKNLVLHGSCMIFAKTYIDKFDGLYDGTFMYYEEDILFYRCMANNLKMLYSPKIQIEHYRNVSTNSVYDKKGKKKKLAFFYGQTVKSLTLLLEMVMNDNEGKEKE